jgi:predicted secreted protein
MTIIRIAAILLVMVGIATQERAAVAQAYPSKRPPGKHMLLRDSPLLGDLEAHANHGGPGSLKNEEATP